MDKRRKKIKVARFTSTNSRITSALAAAVWCHAQRRRFTWTLESMERVIRKCLNAEATRS